MRQTETSERHSELQNDIDVDIDIDIDIDIEECWNRKHEITKATSIIFYVGDNGFEENVYDEGHAGGRGLG